ncbi:unnamed protein product, partial [Lepidochelys olivacea]
MIQPMCYTPLVTHTSHMLRAVSKRTVINSSPCPSEEGQKAMGLICSKGNLVLGVQLFLHQTQRIQFVEVSDTAKIHCSSTENLEGGSSILWYLRREGETPTCIKSCLDDQNVSKFACKHETHSSTLEISNVQKTKSGIYYCAYRYSSYMIFGNGSTLIVGDGVFLVLLAVCGEVCNLGLAKVSLERDSRDQGGQQLTRNRLSPKGSLRSLGEKHLSPQHNPLS